MNKQRYDYKLTQLYKLESQGQDITDRLIQLDDDFNNSIDKEFHTDRLSEYNTDYNESDYN